VAEVGSGIDAAELGGLEQGVEDRGDLGAPLGAGAIVVLPAHHHATKRPLGCVVVQRYPGIVEKDGQPIPEASL